VSIGGQWRWGGEIRERGGLAEKERGGLPRGSPASPRCQTANDKRERFANLWTPERIVQQVSLHLVGLQGRKRKGERGCNKARVFMIEFEFKFKFVCKDFENLPKIDPRGFKHDQKIQAKG
jgi:hypothetical protein